ncbi:hypothetical protein [Tateyamaria sp. ANG-S1]|uniref:hypothetical protein n=1 Tax=Tateyamaria sp. ANG-S1 TaxID=1577905 RepID=UPI0005801AB5|nr:hypothetical protein [Tateyamaria sp. ANG-S1]KIC48173.1 hypothetical protein RA29_16575 [Tateyamaria sp. ANG-S1]
MMMAQTETLEDISIYPYYRGVPLEVDAVAQARRGSYVSGFIAGQSYYTLDLIEPLAAHDLHVGATYTCTAIGPDKRPLKTHWLFCTALAPSPKFGISKHWSNPNSFFAVLPDMDTILVHLEELTDIVAVFPSAAGSTSLSQAQIGRTGWLVMTRIGCPHMIGILVKAPILPSGITQGSRDIVLSARSVRTTQSISLDALTCISTSDEALFLRLDD